MSGFVPNTPLIVPIYPYYYRSLWERDYSESLRVSRQSSTLNSNHHHGIYHLRVLI
jgi:hypothetical protein